MDAVKNFLLAFLPFVAIYLGALSVVRNDIKKLEKKINDLEEKIENAGVSSFYLGKKGLAYVSDIRWGDDEILYWSDLNWKPWIGGISIMVKTLYAATYYFGWDEKLW